jgi:D-alanyl-D-alanine carboxypeptidase
MHPSFVFEKSTKITIFILFLGLVVLPAPVWARTHHAPKHKPVHHFALVDGSASYADLVIDAATGQILHATNPDSLRHPASLTKMMTLYLTFQALESGKLGLNQYLPISQNAAEQSPSKLGLRPGQRIRVEDAILGLVTESANDAAVVLGEWLGGSEAGFAQLMTRQAHALGMAHTRFDNPSGLPDPDQVTTARDMAVLGHSLIVHFPQFYPYFSHDSFTYAGINHHNHNHLMDRYDGMDGIKTGYIRASGFNLVASAKRGSTRLIGVVFGGHSATMRDNQMAQLLDQCFVLSAKDRAARPPLVAGTVDDAQGDGDNNAREGNDYVALPAKVAAIFPPKPDPAAIPPARQDALAQTASKGGVWGIQIGAYNDPAIGKQALSGLVNSMPQLLGTGDQQIQKVSAGSTAVYRARLMQLDQQTAQTVCAYLIQHSQPCLTVGP